MAQNNIFGAGKRLVSAVKGRAASTAEQKASIVRKKIGAIGSTGARLTRTATYEVNRAALKLEGASSGPTSRGGKRRTSSVTSPAADKRPVARTARPVTTSSSTKPKGTIKPASRPVKSTQVESATSTAPTRTVSSIAADYFNSPKTQAGEESYAMHKAYLESTKAKPKAKDVKVGGLLGRTGGKWHLGKRPGKG